MEREPIESRSRSEIVADRILEMLGSPQYAPGQRLPTEKQLCQLFGVGRASVREALKKLEILGIIEIRQGEGTFVQEVSPLGIWETPLPLSSVVTLRKRDLIDLMHVRRTIELETARTAALNRTDMHLERLHALMEQMDEEHNDVARFLATDMQFHMAVAEATANQIFPRLLNQVRELYVQQYKQLICKLPGVTQDSYVFHENIVHAIATRDSARAEAAMARHLENSERITLQLLEHVELNEQILEPDPLSASRSPV